MKRQIVVLLTVALGLSGMAFGKARTQPTLEDRVRHELIMLPYYGVFDNLVFRVDGDKVTLFGEVTRPILKSEAEAVVKGVDGIANVDNRIEVLPLSPNDDRIRMATYRAVYSQPSLNRYALGAHPSIRIIVRNGDVQLEGSVANTMDRTIAGLQAGAVPGVFAVANNLRVD